MRLRPRNPPPRSPALRSDFLSSLSPPATSVKPRPREWYHSRRPRCSRGFCSGRCGAGHREVARFITATSKIQPLPWIPLVVSSYDSPPAPCLAQRRARGVLRYHGTLLSLLQASCEACNLAEDICPKNAFLIAEGEPRMNPTYEENVVEILFCIDWLSDRP